MLSNAQTDRLALPLLESGQAQKEITHNEALQRLDALVQPVAMSADIGAPPPAPVTGQCWIVGPNATGAWSGHAQELAQWTAGGWRFCQPALGWRCHVADRGWAMRFDGAVWQDEAVRGDAVYVDGVQVISTRQPAIADPAGGNVIDQQVRIAISTILATLRHHGLIEA